MSFISIDFILLLLLTYTLYWRLNRRWQNWLLLVASYVFYGWWDWRFLSLILFSSAVDYFCGLGFLDPKKRVPPKILLLTSLLNNLALLGFFKYFNFFIESATDLLRVFGYEGEAWTLRIVLPVGISFYTFQTLSYTVDLYRGRIQAVKDPVQFFTFVSFFPQLVAGPIERAENLLGQFGVDRTFDWDKARDGLRQMLWGFFKKIVVADNVASAVDQVYGDLGSYGSGAVLAATLLFAFQIYCDFSGYSDIAIGCARLFGIQLMRNFAYPYFSRNMAEFWRRWHISLSTWFRDYVYIPLGGGRRGEGRRIWNALITFGVSGLWHGANWTYVVWGFLNGLFVVFFKDRGKKERAETVGGESLIPSPVNLARMGLTFALANLCWVFFRAPSLGDAFRCLRLIFTTAPRWSEFWGQVWDKWYLVAALVLLEWIQRRRDHALDIAHLPRAARWAVYLAVIFAIYIFGALQVDVQFIYFQF